MSSPSDRRTWFSLSHGAAEPFDVDVDAPTIRHSGFLEASNSCLDTSPPVLRILFADIKHALDWIHFPRDAAAGEVPAEVIFDLGLIYGPSLMVLYLLALAAISFYQITRGGHEDRVATLSSRNG